jgi:acyl-CoA synthetase (AMP-forming)/AMP-acid ligase II
VTPGAAHSGSHETVFRALAHSAARHGGKPFIEVIPDTASRYGIDPIVLSYGAALQRISALAESLRRSGIGVGHRVALLLENRPDFFLHWLALNALGASVVPLNPDWREAELDYVLAHSEACLAIVLAARARDFESAAQRIRRPLAVVQPHEVAGLGASVFTAPAPNARPDAHTECALLYTSGTTGEPKGCILPNEYFLWAGTWYAELGGLCRLEEGKERLITPLPMYHMNAMACSTMAMLLTGGCVIPLDRFHPQTWWRNVRESRATIVHYLGVMPAMLLSCEPSAHDTEHAVRFGFGAGVNASDHAAFERRFGFPLVEAWAMTETGCGAAIIANHEPRKIGTACFGAAPARVEYRIVDADGHDAGVDQPGELWVRSAGPDPRFGFFAGYLKNAAATAEAWRDGYFHTGDIVLRDSEGLFHFVDRKKNVIRRSGENIAAVEVESVVKQHPDVAAVAIAGVPDAVRGEEVMACVVRPVGAARSNDAELARSIVAFCLQRLAYYKAPGYVGFCDQLPLTATAKIQRARLKALAEMLHRSGQCVDTRDLKRRNA